MKLLRGSRIAGLAVLGLVLVAWCGPSRADLMGDLSLGGNYTPQSLLNYTFNGAYDGGGGSIDVSKLNGYTLPWVYCTDIPDNVWVPGDYAHTLINQSGKEWWGGGNGNPISGFVSVPNAASVAYLLVTYGNAASAIGRAAEGGLQAAIWQVIYGSPLFQYTPGTASDAYFNAYLADVYNGHSGDPTQWKKADVSQILWMSPSNDPNISATEHSGYNYQGLVTMVPEPSTLAIAGLGSLAIATHLGRRKKSIRA
jgi:hypothetical protein